MTTVSPRASARSVRSSARPDDATPRKDARAVLAHHTLPPVKIETDGTLSSRSMRPASASVRSEHNVRSSRMTPLSSTIKNSSYAQPLSARSSMPSSRNVTMLPSARGPATIPSINAAQELIPSSPRVDPPQTPPVEPMTPSVRGSARSHAPSVKDDNHAQMEPPSSPKSDMSHEHASSVDELLERELLGPSSEVHETAQLVTESPNEERHELIMSVPDRISIGDDVENEVPVEMPEARTMAERAVESALSSFYCNNSTFIASIPEELDISRHIDEERNVGAPSPPEPHPTPAELVCPNESIEQSLNEALVGEESTPKKSVQDGIAAPSPSPINGNMELSQYSAPSVIERQIREELHAREVIEPVRETSKKPLVWRRVFCCGRN